MKGKEFIKRAKKYAKANGLDSYFDPSHGKGSHGMLYIGDRRASVKRSEIGRGLLNAMLKQLNIKKEDF
jgi:mRNA interferase HicA